MNNWRFSKKPEAANGNGNTVTAIRLHCGTSDVTIFPAIGAAIGQWHVGGMALLHGAASCTHIDQAGCFAMLPFANRIAHGELPGAGRLPPHPGEAHSLHGIGWLRAWQLAGQGASHVTLALQHSADAYWPFSFSAVLRIELGPDSLTQTLTLTNDGACSMPAGFGFHPYFPVQASTMLATGWAGLWDVTADYLPTGWRAQPAPAAIAVAGWQVNHCFTQWTGRAVLSWPGHALVISADPVLASLQCYRPGRDSHFVAIEPVTHIPNAHQLRQAGVSDSGMRDLAPGASLEGRMTMQVLAQS